MNPLDVSVTVEGGSQWPAVIAGLSAGLGGALIGTLSIFAVEVWRRVLDFQAAARVVVIEIISNRVSLGQALGTDYYEQLDLHSDGWEKAHLSLSSILDFVDLGPITTDYEVIAITKKLSALNDPGLPLSDEVRSALRIQLELLRTRFENSFVKLHGILRTPRRSLFWSAMRGKSISPSSNYASDSQRVFRELVRHSDISPQPNRQNGISATTP